MGKPDAVIYTSAMEMVGLANDAVIAIGDSLEHDIAGAGVQGLGFMVRPPHLLAFVLVCIG